jgi:hypothetical protein
MFTVPPIRLWCSSEECDGVRTFGPDSDGEITYICVAEEQIRNRFVSFSWRPRIEFPALRLRVQRLIRATGFLGWQP